MTYTEIIEKIEFVIKNDPGNIIKNDEYSMNGLRIMKLFNEGIIAMATSNSASHMTNNVNNIKQYIKQLFPNEEEKLLYNNAPISYIRNHLTNIVTNCTWVPGLNLKFDEYISEINDRNQDMEVHRIESKNLTKKVKERSEKQMIELDDWKVKCEKILENMQEQVDAFSNTVLKDVVATIGHYSFTNQAENHSVAWYWGLTIFFLATLIGYIFIVHSMFGIQDSMKFIATIFPVSIFCGYVVFFLLTKISEQTKLKNYYRIISAQISSLQNKKDILKESVAEKIEERVALNMSENPIFLLKNIKDHTDDLSRIIKETNPLNNKSNDLTE